MPPAAHTDSRTASTVIEDFLARLETDDVNLVNRIRLFINSIPSVQAPSQLPREKDNSDVENISTFVGAVQEIEEISMDVDNNMGKHTSLVNVLED
jgi:hypothetical protein